ncbi:MAG TPA: sigma-54 dependent transcriptional regulator [Polyangia bacterium]|nr:sigma-54 dependent transcriptional regulator [Polyangia bacterium]
MTAESGAQVLVVDDDPAVGKVLAALLAQAGIACHHVLDATRALEALAERAIDVVVTDLRMPGTSGVELLEEIVERWPEIPVVLLTAHGSVEVAVEAMKKGAADFLLKPFDREEILFTVRKQLTRARHGEGAPEAAPIARGGVGSASPRMREVEDMILRAARGDVTVLIRGESGSGKEVVARAIHEAGPRRGAPFVKLHCAALPDTLIESELFGYEKGAFTGAASRKPGRVELAQGGTLFLDEIGDISPFIQVKLLRLLQDREFERLGSTQTLKTTARFVAATHQPLEELIKQRTFREDLFYRLNVLPIWIPPLRERPQDIESLATSFCRQFGKSNGRGELTITGEALALLKTLPWPGNVRQLQNFVERLVVLSDGDALTAKDIERELVRHSALPAAGGPSGTLEASRLDAEKSALVAALAQARNNRSLAARLLGISRRTLYHKLAEHGIA